MNKYELRQHELYDPEDLARQAMQPGLYLYGYCGGIFGRDSYGPKQILDIQEELIVVSELTSKGRVRRTGYTNKWLRLLNSSNEALDSPDTDFGLLNSKTGG